MTREQQLTLIEEARAARRTAQQIAEAADAQMLTVLPDQERAYGNGWG
jgi:DNA-binding MarR family transcriptional regulator